MVDIQNGQCEKPNRTRRSIFVFGGTIMFSGLATWVTLTRDTSIAGTFVDGCLGIIQLIVVSYLFTTTVDRSEVLTNIGHGFRAKNLVPQPPQVAVQVTQQNEDMSDGDAKG